MKIWQKYLLRQLSLTYFFLLFSLFAIYIIVNLSEQGVGLLASKKAAFTDVVGYYAANFFIFFDFFSPLSFLLASLKGLLDLNSHHELVAFQMAGLSAKKILSPFIVFAGTLCLCSYLNLEWFAPEAHETVDHFWNTHTKKKKKIRSEHLHTLTLEDDSELVYQTYVMEENRLYDVIWLRSKREIWRFDEIDLKTKMAKQAQFLLRNEEKLWEKKESYLERSMTEMPLSDQTSIQRFIPFENRSILSLARELRTKLPDRPMALSHFLYKSMRPLVPLLVLIAAAPIAMRFSRTRSNLLLIACSLGLFFAFMTLLDGMLLIGETKLLPATVAILSPFALALGCTFRPFIRL